MMMEAKQGYLFKEEIKMREYVMCCEELEQSIKDGELRISDTHKGIVLGTNVIWYCPFCGEDITWIYG